MTMAPGKESRRGRSAIKNIRRRKHFMEMDKARFADDDILPGDSPVYAPNIMTLQAEDGRNVDFEFLDLIEYDGESYVVLLPAEEEEGEESGKVVILRIDVSDDS